MGSIFFGGTNGMVSQGGNDVFLVRYAANGDFVYQFRYGGTGSETGIAVSAAADGSVLLAGKHAGPISFSTFNLTGTNNVFVTRLTPGITPLHEWAVSLGGNDSDFPTTLVAAPEGSAYVGATFQGMTVIDGQALTALGSDGWFAALVR
jgi:hypothetical protein